ncbi:MAG: SDR family oxidoreductase [Bacteroidetes bacterium]|nr:SDR family oxidoreductase [Bacteroidota bacterium]
MAYALITGASGGIGWSLAKELASRKHDVLLVARSAEKLRENALYLTEKFSVKADFLPTDLSAPGSAENVISWVEKKDYPVDILVNNAGFGLWGNLADMSSEELQQMMQLNMLTLVNLCKAAIPLLKQHNKSYILNVGSTAAYQAIPTLTTYAATKAFVLLFSRGLRHELMGSSISVSCLNPGTTTTGFIDRAHMMDSIRKKSERVTMDPAVVARIGVNGMFAGKAEIIPGALNWISAKLAELMPKSVPEKIAHSLYKG